MDALKQAAHDKWASDIRDVVKRATTSFADGNFGEAAMFFSRAMHWSEAAQRDLDRARLFDSRQKHGR